MNLPAKSQPDVGGLSSLVLLTGMSGSGKHTAARALEDVGFYCVDNLPAALVPQMVEMAQASHGAISRLAVVLDVRAPEPASEFEQLARRLRQSHTAFQLIFLDASNEVLARRFSVTRRRHPLSGESLLLEGLEEERRRLAGIREAADRVIDTSDYSVHDLRRLMHQAFRDRVREDELGLMLLSFGYKFGIPSNADLVFDLRFLPNPYFEAELRDLTGRDEPIQRFLDEAEGSAEILERLEDLLTYLIPQYEREGKSYLTVALGCTGGKHRSVYAVERLTARLKEQGRRVKTLHRDMRK
ncbi:MAG TPA: RNase adapter RapZ [Acidobacteriota bacterium]|nr:RNase adapter RapZ [Acidobacteriota bacterium]